MAKFENKQFVNERIDLDDNLYARCDFTNCTLAFAGGKYSMIDCHINGTFALSLGGHAANALQLLQMLAMYSPDMRRYIIAMLDPKNVTIDGQSG